MLSFSGYLTFGEYLSLVLKDDLLVSPNSSTSSSSGTKDQPSAPPPPSSPATAATAQQPAISMRVTRIDEFAQAVWWMLAHGLLVQLQHHDYVSLENRKSAVAKYLAENQLTESIGYFEQFVLMSFLLLVIYHAFFF